MKALGFLFALWAIASLPFHQQEEAISCTPKVTGLYEVTIGQQVWMTHNLDVAHFRNGDSIFHAKSVEEWEEAGRKGMPAWCYYNNDPANGPAYGKLYNWFAVNDPRGLAPEGWHVPNASEWYQLVDFLGGRNGAVGLQLKSKVGWNKERNGRNTTGFDALPSGVRDTGDIADANQGFGGMGAYGSWWSASGPARRGDDLFSFVLSKGNGYTIHWNDEAVGLAVRCVKNQ
jgi:uncharacterized protein (TIGR02145 family)